MQLFLQRYSLALRTESLHVACLQNERRCRSPHRPVHAHCLFGARYETSSLLLMNHLTSRLKISCSDVVLAESRAMPACHRLSRSCKPAGQVLTSTAAKVAPAPAPAVAPAVLRLGGALGPVPNMKGAPTPARGMASMAPAASANALNNAAAVNASTNGGSLLFIQQAQAPLLMPLAVAVHRASLQLPVNWWPCLQWCAVCLDSHTCAGEARNIHQ